MPKVSQEYQEVRRNQIIEAAVECFSKKGFHQTSMQDIVAESSLSPGAIYLYFKSKEEIIKTIADIRHENERKIIKEASFSEDTSTALGQLIETFFRSLINQDVRKQRNIGVQLWGEALSNPNVYEVVKEGIEEPKCVLVELLTEYQKQGKLNKELSPDAVARVMLAQFQGFVIQMAIDDKFDVDEYIKVVKYLIHGSFLKDELED